MSFIHKKKLELMAFEIFRVTFIVEYTVSYLSCVQINIVRNRILRGF